MKTNKNKEPSKAKPVNQGSYLETQITEYIPNASVNAIIVKKVTANISAMSVPVDETVVGEVIAFNTFIQIIIGSAEVIISNEKHLLKLGDGIIIPANTKYSINAKEEFKMISTIIESGSGDIYVNSLN